MVLCDDSGGGQMSEGNLLLLKMTVVPALFGGCHLCDALDLFWVKECFFAIHFGEFCCSCENMGYLLEGWCLVILMDDGIVQVL